MGFQAPVVLRCHCCQHACALTRLALALSLHSIIMPYKLDNPPYIVLYCPGTLFLIRLFRHNQTHADD